VARLRFAEADEHLSPQLAPSILDEVWARAQVLTVVLDRGLARGDANLGEDA